MSASNDPLGLAGLDPLVIQAKSDAKKVKPISELEQQKESRLVEKEKRLAQPRPLPMPPPAKPPPDTPPPPKVDKSLLLDKIAAYRERFPHVKKRNTITLKSTIDELFDEVHYIELQLGSSGGTSSIASTVFVGSLIGIEKFTEHYWNPLGLNLSGLGTVAKQNSAEFQPILDELMIKYHAGTYTSPEWRLVLMVGATVLTVNASNNDPELARAVQSMHEAVSAPKGAKDL
jgi:hypothetical protein